MNYIGISTNIIGVFGPRLLKLLAIWIPGYRMDVKLILTCVCLIETWIVYDGDRTGRRGMIYRLTGWMDSNIQYLVVRIVVAIPVVAMFIMALHYHARILAVLCVFTVWLVVSEVVCEIKYLSERKR